MPDAHQIPMVSFSKYCFICWVGCLLVQGRRWYSSFVFEKIWLRGVLHFLKILSIFAGLSQLLAIRFFGFFCFDEFIEVVFLFSVLQCFCSSFLEMTLGFHCAACFVHLSSLCETFLMANRHVNFCCVSIHYVHWCQLSYFALRTSRVHSGRTLLRPTIMSKTVGMLRTAL